jgi:ABC-type uncharacterized transport system permease subunit
MVSERTRMEGLSIKQRFQETLKSVYFPFVAIVVSLLFGSVVILATSSTSPLTAYGHMLKGAFGSIAAFDSTLIKAIPLIFTALSFSLARRSGIINLGAEGQFMMGALAATAVGVATPNLPAIIHLPATLLAGFLGGALFGLITGVLKVKFGASELIITIMLNYIAKELISYFVNGPLMDSASSSYPQSAPMEPSARLYKFIPGLNVHTGLLIALAFIFLYYFFLWKTTAGFDMRVVGFNPSAGAYAGMSIGRSTILALFLAGGLAGLGGCIEIIAVQGRLMMTSFAVPYGFTGIAVALLGNLNPLGVLFSGILFGGLSAGALRMEVMTRDVSSSVAVVIQALIILFIAGRQMFAFKRRYRYRPSSEKRKGKTVVDDATEDESPTVQATAGEGV